ncbi:MAG: DUF4136 domain-containing protein [Burkholderiales bacterium]
MRPHLLIAISLVGMLAASGCATQINSDVSTFGSWPADRQPDTYVFERLPSQQDVPDQERMEDAARGALEAAGFKPAPDAQTADVSVLLGTRVMASYFSPFDDAIGWGGGLYRSRFGHAGFVGFGPGLGRGFGGGFALAADDTLRRYVREVSVLIRDRKSGNVVYETHASSDGVLPLTPALMVAMFQAALAPFPGTDAKARSVTTPLAR